MCGIAGIYSYSKKSIELEELKGMTKVIIHRGPDGEGHWINETRNVGFGHRRLAIIDLTDKGHQPMHYIGNRYTITFNGEIYNYIELRKFLKKEGYNFNSDSDTEVILALYDLRREDCLSDLDGMFAFAIWDEVEQTLFCARDRFGEKPFHYYNDGKRFIFASEIKQFWALNIRKEVKEEQILEYINDGFINDDTIPGSTFYHGICKLDAAHYLIIKNGSTPKISKYWDINLKGAKFLGSIEEAAEKFLLLLTNSIKIRLRSDVPVGSSLSGGLDSSAIVMLIDSIKRENVIQNTFSARFKNFVKDEGVHIKKVVESCKRLNAHYIWPDQNYFEKVIDKVIFHQDEPFGSVSIIAQYSVMELAKQNGVTVLLDGQGADEYLAGYLPFYLTYLNQLYYTESSDYADEFKSYNNFHSAILPYKSINGNETLRMKLGRYKKSIFGLPKPYSNALQNELYKHLTMDGLQDLLRYADRNSMAHSREIRLPFLSHELVEFAFSLPDNYKLKSGWTKYILRKSMENILPSSICWRTDKIGYEAPQIEWMNSPSIMDSIFKASKRFNIKTKKKDISHVDVNWRLLMLEKYV